MSASLGQYLGQYSGQYLGQYWLLWRAGLSFTHYFSRRLLLLAAVLVTLVCALAAAWSGSSGAWLSWALCVPAGFLLSVWSMAWLPGALRLNSPANAQMVPGMRRRLIELGLLVWLAGIGVLGVGMTLTAGMPGPSLWLAVNLTLGLGAMTAGIRAASLVYFPVLLGFIAGDALPAGLVAALQGVSASPLALALLPLLGALAMWAIFPQAGARHWKMVARQASAGAVKLPATLDREPTRFSWDGLLLRRAVARRKPDALLVLALGRSMPGALASGLALAALGIGVVVFLAKHGVLPIMTDYFAQFSWITISGVLVVFIFQAGMAPAWLARTTGEQALVRLAPAFPVDAAAFNGLLARVQLRQSLTIWLMASGAALLLGLASGMDGTALWQQAGVCCMTLPTLGLALRNHASRQAWPVFGMWGLAFGLSYVGPLAGIVAYAAFDLPFWPVALATAFTLGAALVRLRLMRAAPIAFPAARLD